MAAKTHLKVCLLSEENFLKMIKIASVEHGWNMGTQDYAVWTKVFGNDSFLCILQNGEPIGTIVATILPNNIGYIGMYYVAEKFRLLGVGKTLFNAAMKRLAHTDQICLAGAKEMHAKYANVYGFSTYQDWTIRQSAGIPKFDQINSHVDGITLSSHYDELLLGKVCHYDMQTVGYDRSKFCKLWLSHPNGSSVVAVDDTSGSVVGYGVIRRCMLKPRIGPIFANSPQLAKGILCRLIELLRDEIALVGVAMIHRSDDVRFIEIADSIGLPHVRTSYMQYTKDKIPFDESRMFVFTDYEVQYV